MPELTSLEQVSERKKRKIAEEYRSCKRMERESVFSKEKGTGQGEEKRKV